jgi:hypothetical protein
LTARGSLLFPTTNGNTQAIRYEAPAIANWMRSGASRQAGAMMLDVYVDDYMCVTSSSQLQASQGIFGTGTAVTTTAGSNFQLAYVSSLSTNPAGEQKRLRLYVRTSDMLQAEAMSAFSPVVRLGQACTAFMLFSSTELSLVLAYADGTLDAGTPVAMPASFIGRVTSGVYSYGGVSATALGVVGFFRGAVSRGAYLRGRVPTDTEMRRVARGESPATVFAGELDRYDPLADPAVLAPEVGSGNLVVQTYGTDVGYAVRRFGTLSGATNGSAGFSVRMPMPGDGWAIDLDDPDAGAPVTLSVTNTLGASATYEARTVLYSDGETFHTDWATMTGGPVAPAATATLTIAGVPASKLIQVEVRDAASPTVTWASGMVGVGPDLIDDGQSQRQIWSSAITTDATSLSTVTIPTPCVSLAWPFSLSGPVGPFRHRLITGPQDTPIGPAAFAKRWAEHTGGMWARIRSTSVPGSGRELYTTNALLSVGPYRYWGTDGVEGTGVIADMILRCGPRFSAIIGQYSTDDLLSGQLSTNLDAYLFNIGSPARSYANITNPLGNKIWVALHDRFGDQTPATMGNWFQQVRTFVAANTATARLAPGFSSDKRMGLVTDTAHQSSDVLTGNARMSYRMATWLAGLLGYTGAQVDSGTMTSVTSSSPFISATCTFTLPAGATLTTTDGLGQAFGFSVSVNGATQVRIPPANAVISGNTVTISGIVGASAASDIRVFFGYDQVWGTSGVPATRFAEDNLTIEKVLLATVPGAPTEPAWAIGNPVRPSDGGILAT